MNKVSHVILVLIVLSPTLCCSHNEERLITELSTLDEDMKALQGEWIIESISFDGDREEELVGMRYLFQGDSLTLLRRNKEPSKFLFILSAPGKGPRRIYCSPSEFQLTEEPSKCIYSLEGNTLMFCARADRYPKTFQALKGDGCRLSVLRRVVEQK